MDPVRQSTSHPASAIRELHVYDCSATRESVLYDDAGDGYGYKGGEYCLQRFTVDGRQSNLQLTREQEGDFAPHYDQYQVVLHGLFSPQAVVECDGNRLEVELLSGGRVLAVTVPATFSRISVSREV